MFQITHHPSKLSLLTKPTRVPVSVDEMIKKVGVIPNEALLFGVVDADGLPLLLNMNDSIPGPVLILAENALEFLCSTIIANIRLKNDESLRVGVISPQDGFSKLALLDEHAFTGSINDVKDDLRQLRQWAKERTDKSKHFVLVIDGVEQFLDLTDEGQSEDLFWLINFGCKYGVTVIVGADPYLMSQPDWSRVLSIFRTRIFGRISGEGIAGRLGCRVDVSDFGPYTWTITEGASWTNFTSSRL